MLFKLQILASQVYSVLPTCSAHYLLFFIIILFTFKFLMFITGLHKCVQLSVLVLHIIYQQVVIQNMHLKYENQFSNSYH